MGARPKAGDTVYIFGRIPGKVQFARKIYKATYYDVKDETGKIHTVLGAELTREKVN